MLEQIREVICNYVDVDPETITADASLRSDLSMSSLDLINVAVEIEDTFDISLPNSDMQNITTVGELITYIEVNK
ncbi:MAG: acyl carrier protein [Clostridia bacterium]|jgi:acyl carrier protein|nr:acyl carrier protein [Clostridia bacterium]